MPKYKLQRTAKRATRKTAQPPSKGLGTKKKEHRCQNLACNRLFQTLGGFKSHLSQSRDPNCSRFSMSSADEEKHAQASSDGEPQEIELDFEMDCDGNLAEPSDAYWENFHSQFCPDDEEIRDDAPQTGRGIDGVTGKPIVTGQDDRPPSSTEEDRRHKPTIPGTRTEWHPHGGKTFGKRKDIFEKIRTDSTEDGKTRHENVYHPFRDGMDYEMARHLSKLNIPMTEVDEWLKLEFVRLLFWAIDFWAYNT